MSPASARIQPIELGKPPRDRVPARPGRGQLMGQLMPLLAQLGQRIAALRQRSIGLLLRRLGLGDRRLDRRDFLGGRLRFRVRGLRSALGFDPAGMQQPRFDAADLLGQLAIALGRARLAAKLRRALFLVAEDLAQPGEIGFGGAQLLLGVLAPGVKAGNARGFLEQ